MTDPIIGDLVHYVEKAAPNSELTSCKPAIVNQVPGIFGVVTSVSLTAFTPYGTIINWSCVQNEESYNIGTWHWPEGAISGV